MIPSGGITSSRWESRSQGVRESRRRRPSLERPSSSRREVGSSMRCGRVPAPDRNNPSLAPGSGNSDFLRVTLERCSSTEPYPPDLASETLRQCWPGLRLPLAAPEPPTHRFRSLGTMPSIGRRQAQTHEPCAKLPGLQMSVQMGESHFHSAYRADSSHNSFSLPDSLTPRLPDSVFLLP
jgi:hypothetical protein